jgi:uncharacterized PurR-regulated membrane protein YhhQ (DUF165 family)
MGLKQFEIKKLWYELLVSSYICTQIVSPIFNAKVVYIAGTKFLGWAFMAGIVLSLLNTINANYGKETARRIVVVAFIIRTIFYVGVFPILISLPSVEGAAIDGLFRQGFRNFLVQDGLTFLTLYFVNIPIFTKIKSLFIVRFTSANVVSQAILKPAVQTLLQYAGTGIDLPSLIFGQVWVKALFIMLGSPLGIILNKITKRVEGRIEDGS